MAIAPQADVEHVAPARGPRPSPALIAAGSVVAAASLLPVAYLVIRAFQAGGSRAAEILIDARTAGLLIRTIALTCAVTATTTVLGVVLAWLTERTDLPAPRVWTVVLALPLVIPSYVGAYAFLAAFGSRGLITSMLPAPSGFIGAWFVLSILTYPYVFLAVRAGLRRLDRSFEEAARGLGRSRARAFVSVVVPLLRPSIAAGALLVALYTMHDFGAVSLLGFDTFTRAIFVRYNASFDRTSAAVLALVLVALSLCVLLLEARARRRHTYHRAHAGAPSAGARLALGRLRVPAMLLAALPVLAGVVVPAGVIVAWFVRGVRASAATSVTFTAAANSVKIALVAASVSLVAALPVALLAARHRGRWSSTIERASYAGFALPGLVIALAMVFFSLRIAPALYQTITVLVFAYAVLFLSHAVGPMRAALMQVPASLDEAAASLGAGRARRLMRVGIPLAGPGIAAGSALVFLTVMKELPATLLLAPTGFDTLATKVWSATSAGSFAGAAIPALALLVLSSGPIAVMLARGESR